MNALMILALVLANLGSLYGVWVLEWSVTVVLFFYWFETAVIGLYTVFKILKAKHISPDETLPAGDHNYRMGRLFFFLAQFTAFMVAHLVFLITLFAPIDQELGPVLDHPGILLGQIKYAAVFLVVAHGVSLWKYMKAKEYLNAEIDTLIRDAFRRVIFMHLILIGGGWATVLFNIDKPFVFLTVAVVAKTFFDLKQELWSHGALQKE